MVVRQQHTWKDGTVTNVLTQLQKGPLLADEVLRACLDPLLFTPTSDAMLYRKSMLLQKWDWG